jgi:hypothetical protein
MWVALFDCKSSERQLSNELAFIDFRWFAGRSLKTSMLACSDLLQPWQSGVSSDFATCRSEVESKRYKVGSIISSTLDFLCCSFGKVLK